MPKATKEYPITIGFRASEADARKLAALAKLTYRGQGEVLRMLLQQAIVAGMPDIRLAPRPKPDMRVQEAADDDGC